MKRTDSVFIAAVLVIGCAVGCSSEPGPAERQPGTLPAGTAQLSIDGINPVTPESVQCMTGESLTMITTRGGTSETTAMVSTAKEPVVESITIQDPEGFTGGYNRDLGGDATVTMTGATYEISGTARGYTPKAHQPDMRPFTLKVSC